MPMRDYPYSVCLDESLLDDVRTADVADEEEDMSYGRYYEFSFNFDPYGGDANAVKRTFFKFAMEPALERLRNMGYVDKWKFYRRFEKADDCGMLDMYSHKRYFTAGKKQFKDSKTLRIDVFFSKEHMDDESFGFMTASLMNAMMRSSICTDMQNIRLVVRTWTENGDGTAGMDSDVRCVFHDKNLWCLFAGDDMRVENHPDRLAALELGFVRNAARLGMIGPVDESGSRFVMTSFGSAGETVSLVDSEGNSLGRYETRIDILSYGPKFLDNGLMFVKFNYGRFNYIRMDGTLLSDIGFNECGTGFSEGYVWVQLRGTSIFNMVDENGKLLCKYPDSASEFASVENFVDGISIVVRSSDSKYNFIDKSGNPVLDEWYEYLSFGSGDRRDVAVVRRLMQNGGGMESNYVRRDGTLVLENWVPGKSDAMENGFAKVHDSSNYVCNYIREDGSFVSDTWFHDVCGWPERGMFAFKKYVGWQFMDMATMKPLFGGEMFDKVEEREAADESEHGLEKFFYYAVEKGFSVGEKTERLMTFVSADGVKCHDWWFHSARYVGYGFVSATRKFLGKTYVIRWGKGIVQKELSDCDYVVGRYIRVSRYNRASSRYEYNYLNKDGVLISEDWFENTGKTTGGFMVVQMKKDDESTWNVLTCKGVYLGGKKGLNPIMVCSVVPDRLAIVEKIGNDNDCLYNLFDADGKQLLDEWTAFRIMPDSSGVLRVGPASYVDYSGNIAALI